jgi:hypothetical protein
MCGRLHLQSRCQLGKIRSISVAIPTMLHISHIFMKAWFIASSVAPDQERIRSASCPSLVSKGHKLPNVGHRPPRKICGRHRGSHLVPATAFHVAGPVSPSLWAPGISRWPAHIWPPHGAGHHVPPIHDNAVSHASRKFRTHPEAASEDTCIYIYIYIYAS